MKLDWDLLWKSRNWSIMSRLNLSMYLYPSDVKSWSTPLPEVDVVAAKTSLRRLRFESGSEKILAVSDTNSDTNFNTVFNTNFEISIHVDLDAH